MANLVDRATSDMLGGPDWAMNMELCDIINNDPGHAKDAVRAVKKRLGNKNPKVQLLALTMLETMIKNCGDIVHHQVAGKDVLREMVKIAKKNKNTQVRDKILFLIDSWQEAFGGARGRYPQYFMAYDELRRSGVMFPRRAETASPIYTPPQTQPIPSNFPSPPRSPNYMTSRMDASTAADLPGLSLTEMQNARGGMEVLSEMLNAVNPGDKLDEVIMELVEQCRTAEKRVMQLVNSTSDEELLRQGLSLNDDLKRVLQRHDAIASGAPRSQDTPTAPPLLLIDNHQQGDSDDGLSQLSHRSTSKVRPQSQTSSFSNSLQLALPAPAQSQKKMAPPATTLAPEIDLLSGETFLDNSQSSAPVTPPNVQHIEPSLSTLAQSGAGKFFGNNGSFQATPSTPSFYSSPQQHQQTYAQSNGALPGQSGMPFYQNNYNQGHQGQTPTHSVGQFHENNYIAPWAQPSGPSLSPQQQILIYGTEQSAPQVQSPQSPQQLALTYTPQVPNMSQPTAMQAYSSYLQPQHAYGSSQAQPQQNFGSVPYGYGSPQGQPQQALSFNRQSPKSHLPPAPWSSESPQAVPSLSQQASNLHGNTSLSSFPQPSAQYSDTQQLFQQQQQQFFAAGQLSPQIATRQFGPQIGEANLSAQMQNLSFQRGGGYYSPMQSAGQYMQQSEFTFHQKQAAPMKETKPEDNLFKDLVDFSKSNKGGTSSK